MATVPDLIAISAARPDDNPMTEEQAEQELNAHHLRLGSIRRVNRARRHLGVIAMAPPPGVTVDDWTEVDITLNEEDGGTPLFGVTPQVGIMPCIKGKDFKSEALPALKEAGLTLTSQNIVEVFDDYSPKGEVMFQFPEEGKRVDPNDPRSWRIQVSKGKDPHKGKAQNGGKNPLRRIWEWAPSVHSE